MSSATGAARQPLKLAILGTRGIPARYGGFETFAQELSRRLAARGHEVTVYGRSRFVDPKTRLYRGVRIRVLPAIPHKYLETVSHTVLSVLVALFESYDVLLICNAANAFLCRWPHLAGQKTVLNVDGIERLRKKWNWMGKAFYRLGEILATQLPDAAVADARTIRDYYLREYGVAMRLIAYGAFSGPVEGQQHLDQLGLERGRYLLYVSRLEPENNAHLVVEAYLQSGLRFPLVLVGDAPYSRRYIEKLRRLASRGRVLMPGAIYGSGYWQLLANCLCFVQATEVGGTHPALIEAMGAGALVLANDTPENREVVGQAGLLYPFNDGPALSALMTQACGSATRFEHLREHARRRVRKLYDWEDVVTRYEELFYELASA